MIDVNLEERLKNDWLFGLLFYGEKVSRNQLMGRISEHSSAVTILKYANGIESILDEMTEEEWDTYGRERIRVLLFVIGYMRNTIRMNGKTYYSILEHVALKNQLSTDITFFEKWLKENNAGMTMDKFNSVGLIMPEKE